MICDEWKGSAVTTNAKDKKSGRELGADNLQRFDDWIKEHDVAGDWPDYVRGDKLNRSEIAEECGFALSVVRQNPAVKAALVALEDRLRAMGVLEGQLTPVAKEDADGLAVERRIMISKGRLEKRVKELEEQNATLWAEVLDLREQLLRYRHLDAHLCETGRLLHP